MNERNIKLINTYFEGSISKENLLAFDKKMIEDEAFKKAVNFEILMRESLDDSNWSFINDVDYDDLKNYKEALNNQKTKELKHTLKTIAKTTEQKKIKTSEFGTV